jgi:hypothetical protein
MPRLDLQHLLLAAAAAALFLSPVATAGPPGPAVPETIAVEEGHKVFLVGHAVGVQIYTCGPAGGGFAWTLLAPRADLFDAKGKLVATHFGGPTWKARDGSEVVGQRVDGVNLDPTAIDWLLLSARSTTRGADGDRLGATTFVQRTKTTGGLRPAAETCNATTVGSATEVPYTADYHFWKAAGR